MLIKSFAITEVGKSFFLYFYILTATLSEIIKDIKIKITM